MLLTEEEEIKLDNMIKFCCTKYSNAKSIKPEVQYFLLFMHGFRNPAIREQFPNDKITILAERKVEITHAGETKIIQL